MYFQYAFASPALTRLVRSAWSVSYDERSTPMPGIIAPDAHVEFLFQTGAPCNMHVEGSHAVHASARAMVFGLRHGALRLQSTGANAIIGFRVAPAVASAILGRPLVDCWDRPVPLSDFIGAEAEALLEQLDRAPLVHLGPLLEAWLCARLQNWNAEDRRNLDLQDAMMWRINGESVRAFAERLGLSERSVRRYCERSAGLSPKQLVMSGRMLRACAALIDEPRRPVSDVAGALGFGDQSAFANAFRRYVGMTPARFRAHRIVHCERA